MCLHMHVCVRVCVCVCELHQDLVLCREMPVSLVLTQQYATYVALTHTQEGEN